MFVKQTALLYPLAHLCRQDKHLVAEVGGTSTMPPTLVNKALDDFRRGAVMVLIATDAAEEGIDVADCSFVVRFRSRMLTYAGLMLTYAHVCGCMLTYAGVC